MRGSLSRFISWMKDIEPSGAARGADFAFPQPDSCDLIRAIRDRIVLVAKLKSTQPQSQQATRG